MNLFPFLGRVVAVDDRPDIQTVTNLFDKIHNIDRYAVVVQRLIFRLFPDVIFRNVLIGLAAVHFIQIIGIKPSGSPKVFFRATNLFAEVLM